MYLSLSVNIHQSFRFKMNVKLFEDHLGFIRIIQLAITNIRIGMSRPNIFLLSLLFLISLHFSLRLMRSFGLSRSFLKKRSLLKGSLWLFCFCHLAGKFFEYFADFWLKIFEQLPQQFQLSQLP